MKKFNMKFFEIFILNISITAILTSGLFINAWSQGNYAPTLKKLIGKTFTDEKKIPGLNGYSFREGTMITDTNDPEPQFINVFLKGTKAVVVYSARPDTIQKVYYILDVIEIRNMLPGWEIRTVGCQEGEMEDQIVIALVNPGKSEYAKIVKQAWLCFRDKLRFETISAKNVKCINEGQD